ncbi:Nif3-like dinuclear metal center hexameric protein [Kineobactrum sediminis]|uniref:Nif3-like dinuclear metal center hexameric protein n=1 Tax=Kineobactrum sediminis TaxID=1905677 RepID=A0A2N5Y3F4_9GAMM|nr:Nif3-like dinuclear metal center hexameric protein [Kineobactrum sediminis]PLW82919.1 Nif3-like dinuclear metal center hexameric protein [Kineobactrum sediminis]
MSVALDELVGHLEETLQPQRFQDYCPNGLQVQGKPRVARLVTGVTACQALLDAAIAWQADAVLVHHGYFWKGESPLIVGMKRRRLGLLLQHDVSLLAYHLPLDAHVELGNNACLGKLLGIVEQFPMDPSKPEALGNIGSLPGPVLASALVSRLATLTGRAPLYIGDPDRPVQRLAWCTGAAQSWIEAAYAAGADLFITGEASEQTVHFAREEGIGFIAAGHHATERYGVQALGEHLAGHFGIEHRFIDIENPV